LAYPTLFVLLAGDGVRYLIGWYGYLALAAVAVVASVAFIAINKDKSLLRRFPLPLAALLVMMGLSGIWSNYPLISLAAFGVQVATTLVAVFFAIQFDWRQLLNVFANTIRFVQIGRASCRERV
jgi:hypothetical protein